ncbi:MAG: peptidase T [Erysipelotrichaceae bacterium]|nr:peptidase T [Erysipelotrichaceae bacterium]
MKTEEKLIRYCRIDTQSDPANEDVTPSSAKQFDLARLLEKELTEMGMQDVSLDGHCYVYAKLPSNLNYETKTVGFIAHMDTAPDYSGTNVNPRIIECFDGNDIPLNPEVTLKMDDFPWMRQLKGKRLIVTDGNTLLGGDDKAGIAAIMEAMEYLIAHPEIKHGPVAVGFTPDEEIGNGTKYFDIEKFGADFAYTMDGGSVRELADETFNAASAVVTFTGFSIHPGEAKDRMINASRVATEYEQHLPQHMVPEHTDGRDGFIHLHGMKGDCDKAELTYILRDHDADKLEAMKDLMRSAADLVNRQYGEGSCTVTFRDSYRNMIEVLRQYPQVTAIAREVMEGLGLSVVSEPVRGGTDGAQLSFRGLPCPNLGCGGGNFHGRYEYLVSEELDMAVNVILGIINKTSER